MVKVVVIAALFCAAVIVPSGMAAAQIDSVCRFTGTVEAAGKGVAGGTLITAIIDGDKYHTHTPRTYDSSTYSITIRPPNGKSYADGTEVEFVIDGYSAEQTGVYYAGSSSSLDLTTEKTRPVQLTSDISQSSYTGTSGSAVTLSMGAIVGLCFGVLALGGLTYYFLLLRRVMNRRLVKRKAEVGITGPRKPVPKRPPGGRNPPA